jgi:hypothetical protein
MGFLLLRVETKVVLVVARFVIEVLLSEENGMRDVSKLVLLVVSTPRRGV